MKNRGTSPLRSGLATIHTRSLPFPLSPPNTCILMSPSRDPASDTDELSIADLQRHIHQMYFEKDVARGVDGTFMWLMEEVGELASALRGQDHENLA